MALTESTMLDLGSAAPDFLLPATDGSDVSLKQFTQSRALVVLFVCNHCPYVVHIAEALSKIATLYQAKGVGFIAISSNDADNYSADSFDLMKLEAQKWNYSFPYCYDENQAVAKAYNAACTPDLYVFDEHKKLAYRGQFDSTRPHRISSGNYNSAQVPATGEDLKKALDQLLAGEALSGQQVPSMGCNIKWKLGNEPDYS